MTPDPLQPFELSDHTADIRLTARGQTLDELFVHAGQGLLAAVGDLHTTGEAVSLPVELSADNREDLLHDFLSEILFLFDNQHLVTQQVHLRRLDAHGLEADVIAAPLDRAASALQREVKAVTYHELSVRQQDGVWIATAILDI